MLSYIFFLHFVILEFNCVSTLCYSCQGVCISVTKLLRVWSWQKCNQVIKRRNCHFPLTISIIIFLSCFFCLLQTFHLGCSGLLQQNCDVCCISVRQKSDEMRLDRSDWSGLANHQICTQIKTTYESGSDLIWEKIDFCLLSGCTFRLLNSPLVLWLLNVYSRQFVCHCTCFQSHAGVFLQIYSCQTQMSPAPRGSFTMSPCILRFLCLSLAASWSSQATVGSLPCVS